MLSTRIAMTDDAADRGRISTEGILDAAATTDDATELSVIVDTPIGEVSERRAPPVSSHPGPLAQISE